MDLSAINWVDVVLGGIVVISSLLGIVRGLVRELLSTLSWIISLWLAYEFAGAVAETYVMQVVSDRSISYMLAFGGIFFVALFCFGLQGLLLAQFFARSSLGGVDLLFGLLFGFLRGLLFATLLVFCLRYTALSEHPSWLESKLQPTFSRLVHWGVQQLEPKISSWLLMEGKETAGQNSNEAEANTPPPPVLELESMRSQ